MLLPLGTPFPTYRPIEYESVVVPAQPSRKTKSFGNSSASRTSGSSGMPFHQPSRKPLLMKNPCRASDVLTRPAALHYSIDSARRGGSLRRRFSVHIVLSSVVGCPQFMEVAYVNLNRNTCPPKVDLNCLPSFRCQRNQALPSRIPLTAFTPFPRPGMEDMILHPRNVIRRMKLVGPFVVALVPSTTWCTQTSLPLPCSRLARSPGSNSDHTPTRRRFNHLADYCQAPGTSRQPQCFPG
jgi:hypothetical protein